MAQTPEGAIKALANKAGIPLSMFLDNLSRGLKWCYQCKAFHSLSEFGKDSSRYDGLTPRCTKSKNARTNELYVPIPPEKQKKRGPSSGKQTEEGHRRMKAGWARRKAAGLPGPRLGIKHTIETRIKISAITRERTPRGKDCPSFKDGKAVERRGERFSAEYKRWRFDVYSRDEFACQLCGDDKGGNLIAHHILGFADFPALRFYVPNGITVCEDCHKEIHYGERQ